jgi:hypothetical protein
MQSIAKWEIFEQQFTSKQNFANPFLDIDLQAVMTCGRLRQVVDGFYDGVQDGRHVWRVRFAPMQEGLWQYEMRSNAPELDGLTGSFQCVEPVSAGGLTTNPHFANWFFREDGNPQWIVNEGWYPHPANGGDFDYEEVNFPQPTEQDMIDYFRILSGYGVNMVIDIAQLYARQTFITDPTFRWPWAVVDAKNNKIDKDRFNLLYYQRMDRVMQAAKQYGLFFAMELLYDNSVVRPREWSHHPLNVQNGGWLEGNEHGTGWDRMFDLDNPVHVHYTARYLKYTVARFAAYWNVFWSIGSENGNLIRLPQEILPYALFSPEKTAAWYNYWGDFIARKDPYGRLRTFGDAGKQPLMVTTAHNNVIITQDPRNYRKHDPDAYYQAMNDFGEFYWHYGRPVVIGEMTAGTGGHYDMERRLYWIGLTAGYMMGRADRHFAPIVNGRLLESRKYQVDGEPPIYTDLANMTRFIKEQKIPFWRMRPSDYLIDTAETMVYCLAADGEAWLIYYVHGGQATLDLPGAAYIWFNPATGQIVETGTCASGRATFTAPDDGDWVLYLKV